MRSWLFYPPKEEEKKFSSPEEHLLYLLFELPADKPLPNEWNEEIPESREPIQQPSLGFYCGDSLSGKTGTPDLFAGLPPFPVRGLNSIYMVMPKTWQNNVPAIVIDVKPPQPPKFFIQLKWKNITIAGMLMHDPCFSIRGGRTFIFSKYLEKGQSPFMKPPVYFYVEQHEFPAFLRKI